MACGSFRFLDGRHGSECTRTRRRRSGYLGIPAVFLICSFFQTSLSADEWTGEWGDIPYTQGNYSQIYFDYDSSGTFYCINDWAVNQEYTDPDDGTVYGGLYADEYNQFTFTIGSWDYELRIYADGTPELYQDGTLVIERDGDEVGEIRGLSNLQTAVGWATSPNWGVKHTIFEFQFTVDAVRIGRFGECDPGGASFSIWGAPPRPEELNYAPSGVGHVTDGVFTEFSVSSDFPDITRPFQDPIADPWLVWGFDIFPQEGGGLIVSPIPEPTALIIWSLLGGIAVAAFRRRIA